MFVGSFADKVDTLAVFMHRASLWFVFSLEEFTDGFGKFLSYVNGHEDEDPEEVAAKSRSARNSTVTEPDESEMFDQMLCQINGHEVVRDPNSLKEIWHKLKGSDPNSVTLFEDFLAKVTTFLSLIIPR